MHIRRELAGTAVGPGPGMERGIALRASGLGIKRGGRLVLGEISLALATGSITAIVGRSGVGKTTLISALNGLVVPSAGTIERSGIGPLGGRAQWRAARRQTATIFQNHALIDRLAALDNVLLGLADRRSPWSPLPWPKAMRERAAVALDEVGLLSKAFERVSRLSGGERQRVGIARALVRKPELLLGDEPFSAADPQLADELAELIHNLARGHKITVLLALHQIHLARNLAERIVGLANGRIVFDGPAHAFDTAAEATVFRRDQPVFDPSPLLPCH